MENDTLEEFGLASDGIEQAKLAGELFDKELKSKNISIETVRICYSPLSRTTHTAKIVANVLGISFESFQCKAMTELRKRFIGPLFELLSHDKYAEIWALDENYTLTAFEGGESVLDVGSRLLTALTAMEAEYQGCNILVVNHGDPVQILQTILNAAEEKIISRSRHFKYTASYEPFCLIPTPKVCLANSHKYNRDYMLRILIYFCI